MSKWISIENGLPNIGESILCFSLKRGVWLDEYIELHESPVSFSSQTIAVGEWFADDYLIDITHWMPLPQPPGTGENNG